MTSQHNTKLLTVVFTVTLILGGLVAFSLFIPPSSIQDSDVNSRQIASVSGVEASKTSQQKNKKTVFQYEKKVLSCEEKTEFVVSEETHQTLLLAESCRKSADQLEITNLTSKLSATVFQLTPKQFSSDLIALLPGMNIIEVKETNSAKKVFVRTVEIVRGLPKQAAFDQP